MASRLGDTKQSLWSRLKRLALTDVNAIIRGLNAADLEQLERLLIEADFGVPATVALTQGLEDEVRKGSLKTEADLKRELRARILALLAGPGESGPLARANGDGPTVILMVGVNGTARRPLSPSWARLLRPSGAQSAARRGRHVSGGGDRATPDLGRSARPALRVRRPGWGSGRSGV